MRGSADGDVAAFAEPAAARNAARTTGQGHDVLAGCWMRGVGKPCTKLASISGYAMTAVAVSGDLRNCEISLKINP